MVLLLSRAVERTEHLDLPLCYQEVALESNTHTGTTGPGRISSASFTGHSHACITSFASSAATSPTTRGRFFGERLPESRRRGPRPQIVLKNLVQARDLLPRRLEIVQRHVQLGDRASGAASRCAQIAIVARHVYLSVFMSRSLFDCAANKIHNPFSVISLLDRPSLMLGTTSKFTVHAGASVKRGTTSPATAIRRRSATQARDSKVVQIAP